jgi:hypothetical protein
MKTISIQALVLIFLMHTGVQSQDTSIIKYLPLQIGNVWVYNYSGIFAGTNVAGYEKIKVTGTVIYGSKVYFQYLFSYKTTVGNPLTTFSYFYAYVPGYIRTDSITGNIIQWEKCGTGVGYLRDSLKTSTSSSYQDCGVPFPNNNITLNNEGLVSVFGITKNCKNFQTSPPVTLWFMKRQFIKDIGIYYEDYEQNLTHIQRTLKGCVINGQVYGDTNFIVLGVKKISDVIPIDYRLYQNYPNPFNPETRIRFQIINRDNVLLRIYDINGKEVNTPVNEILLPGIYEVPFTLNNLNNTGYSSSIYFYRIETSNYSETKKMILLK